MSAALELPALLSVAEFLAWETPDNRRWQLVDGRPQAMAPASPIHSWIQNELGSLLRNHLVQQGGKCRAYGTPGVMLGVRSDRNFRIPDIGVTCTPLIPGEPNIPDPILLVEILSPSNPAETWINVWAYTTIASVREILVVRTDAIGVQLLRRNPDGTWPMVPTPVSDELVLDSIGFQMRIAPLYTGTWLADGGPQAA